MSAILATIAADPLLALLLQLAVTATAVAAAVLGVAFALRRATAPVRAAWLLAGVATLLLLPAATVLARATPFGLPLIPATAAPAAEQELEVQTKVGIGALLQAPIEARSPVEPGAASAPPSATPGLDAARAAAVSPRVAGAWLALAWLAAAAVEALLQLRAAFGAARLRRRSRPATDAAALAEVAALARELGLRAPPLRCSSELPCPATMGAWRPVVVLPQHSLALPAAARAAVLRHELVHVALRHPQQALLLALLRVLFPWHPLVRRVAARLAHLHEELADNGALAGGVEPLAYARTLLSFAAASRGLSRAPQALFAVGRGLARRIERLTESEPETMTTTTTRIRAAAAAAATILALLPYAVRVLPAQEPTAGAQTKTTAPDPRDAATYMPQQRGTRWTWRSTWVGDDGKNYEHMQFAEVFGEVPIGETGRLCTQVVFAGNENPEYWSAGPDGLRQHDNAYIGERGVAATGDARWLAAPVGAVTRWEWDSQMACQSEGGAGRPDPETLRVHHAAELVAFDEAVTVPAGTFRCAHVRVTETNRDWEKPHTVELWLGRGTGIVKRIDSQIGTRELIAFAPGEAVPDRDVALQQALAREGAEHVMKRVEWLAPGEWSCHVQGDFAVVWLGEGGTARCFHVDRTATPFALDDVAFWSARFADDANQFRWASGQQSSGGGAQVTLRLQPRNSAAALQLGVVAARLSAMRTFALPTNTKWLDEQSQTVGEHIATAAVDSIAPAAAPDGTALLGSCRFEFTDGVLKTCTIGTMPRQR